MPRLALVGVLTAVLLAALGAAGSVGYAGGAISSFSSGIRDAIHVSQPSVKSTGQGGASTNVASTDRVYAWQDQYNTTFPLCHKPGTLNQTKYLPLSAFPGHLGHGDTTGPCPGDE